MKRSRKSAIEHWKYTLGIIERTIVLSEAEIELLKFLYISAFIHGWKHGEAMRNEIQGR